MNRILLFINICLLLISCGNEHRSEGHSVLRFNASNGITSLDPAFASNQDNIWVTSQMFGGLISLDTSLNPQPEIASSWEILDSGKTYLFHLRSNVLFHPSPLLEKGRKVTAQDFIFSFNRIRDPKTASPGAWIFGNKLADTAFIALNDSTLMIRLEKPFSPFLSLLSMPYCNVVPHEAIVDGRWKMDAPPIGTGPFKFDQWEEDVKLILKRNESYNIPSSLGSGNLEAISISFIKSRETAFMELIQGKLDFAREIDPGFRGEIIDANGNLKEAYKDEFYLQRTPFLNTEYLAIYLEQDSSSPLSYVDFRRALNLAIDKSKMIRYLRTGVGTPANGSFVPPGLPGSYASKQPINYDIHKAKMLLKEIPEIERNTPLVLTTTKDYEDLCVFVQGEWDKIGIKCEIQVVAASQLKDLKRNGSVAFFRASWIADYADAENYLSCFVSSNFAPNGPNYTHFNSAKFDSLYNATLRIAAPGLRAENYRQMDSIIVAHGAIIPLYYDESVWLVSKRIKDLYSSPMNIPYFKYVNADKI